MFFLPSSQFLGYFQLVVIHGDAPVVRVAVTRTRKTLLFLMRKQETIEMFRKQSPKTPVVGTTSKYFVCCTREARYGGYTTKATVACAQKCLTSFPVPVAVHKTVGAKSP